LQNEKSNGVNPLVEPFDLTFFAPISLPINPTLCKVDCISSQALLLLEEMREKETATHETIPLSVLAPIPLLFSPPELSSLLSQPSPLDGLYNLDPHLEILDRYD